WQYHHGNTTTAIPPSSGAHSLASTYRAKYCSSTLLSCCTRAVFLVLMTLAPVPLPSDGSAHPATHQACYAVCCEYPLLWVSSRRRRQGWRARERLPHSWPCWLLLRS